MLRQPAVLMGTLILAAEIPARTQPEPATKVVHVVAERFSFTPSEITVDQDTILELRITSDDTDHGFRLSGPDGIDVEIPKRGRRDVRVVVGAREPGRYTFECSRICGAGHGFMRGTLRVVPRRADVAPSSGRVGGGGS